MKENHKFVSSRSSSGTGKDPGVTTVRVALYGMFVSEVGLVGPTEGETMSNLTVRLVR